MLVPGHAHDLFLSYAHAEATWVGAFKQALVDAFQVQAGKRVSVWHDEKNLRAGEDWPEGLEAGVRNAAALLAILSPSYHTSDWCAEERKWLLEHHGGLDGLKIDRFYRFLKIGKARSDYDFWTNIEHIKFFNDAIGEFPLDSADFKVAVGKTVSALRELFRLIGNGYTKVYLARGHRELAAERRRLEDELTGRGYKVMPDFVLTAEHGAEKLVEQMEPCSRTIFLLGGQYDKFVEEQLKQAVALGKPVLRWIHPRLAEKPMEKQKGFLEWLAEREDLPKGSERLGGSSITTLLEQLEPKLKDAVKAQAASQCVSGKLRVYLIYDSTLPPEVAAASRVESALGEQSFEVAHERRDGRHEDLMRTADALLLLRATTDNPDKWLKLTATDVIFGAQMFQREKDFRAAAFLLADPARLTLPAGNIPVLTYADPFSARTLDPFFQKLETSRSADAGR